MDDIWNGATHATVFVGMATTNSCPMRNSRCGDVLCALFPRNATLAGDVSAVHILSPESQFANKVTGTIEEKTPSQS